MIGHDYEHQPQPREARVPRRPEHHVLPTVDDGMPQSTAVWCLIDDGVLETSILMNRQKYKNLARHPKPGLFVLDTANPSRSVERRAEVEPAPDPHKALLHYVAAHYVVAVEAFGASGDDPATFKSVRLVTND